MHTPTRSIRPVGRWPVAVAIVLAGTLAAGRAISQPPQPAPASEPAAKPPAEKRVKFEFNNKPWKQVFEWLSDTTGLTFTTGDGSGNSTMTFHGTLADINTALATAKYTPTANYNGAAQIQLQATDTFGGIVATGTGSATADAIRERAIWAADPLGDIIGLVEGRVDAVLAPGGAPWDHAPQVLLTTEAGGRFADRHGGRRFDVGGGVYTNGLLEAAVVPFATGLHP